MTLFLFSIHFSLRNFPHLSINNTQNLKNMLKKLFLQLLLVIFTSDSQQAYSFINDSPLETIDESKILFPQFTFLKKTTKFLAAELKRIFIDEEKLNNLIYRSDLKENNNLFEEIKCHKDHFFFLLENKMSTMEFLAFSESQYHCHPSNREIIEILPSMNIDKIYNLFFLLEDFDIRAYDVNNKSFEHLMLAIQICKCKQLRIQSTNIDTCPLTIINQCTFNSLAIIVNSIITHTLSAICLTNAEKISISYEFLIFDGIDNLFISPSCINLSITENSDSSRINSHEAYNITISMHFTRTKIKKIYFYINSDIFSFIATKNELRLEHLTCFLKNETIITRFLTNITNLRYLELIFQKINKNFDFLFQKNILNSLTHLSIKSINSYNGSYNELYYIVKFITHLKSCNIDIKFEGNIQTSKDIPELSQKFENLSLIDSMIHQNSSKNDDSLIVEKSKQTCKKTYSFTELSQQYERNISNFDISKYHYTMNNIDISTYLPSDFFVDSKKSIKQSTSEKMIIELKIDELLITKINIRGVKKLYLTIISESPNNSATDNFGFFCINNFNETTELRILKIFFSPDCYPFPLVNLIFLNLQYLKLTFSKQFTFEEEQGIHKYFMQMFKNKSCHKNVFVTLKFEHSKRHYTLI